MRNSGQKPLRTFPGIALAAGAEVGHLAVGEAVHIRAALDEDRRLVAATADASVRFVLVDYIGLTGAGVIGQLLGPLAFADDDALVAGGAVDDEIAEGIGINTIVVAQPGDGWCRKAGGQRRQRERRKAKSARIRTHDVLRDFGLEPVRIRN